MRKNPASIGVRLSFIATWRLFGTRSVPSFVTWRYIYRCRLFSIYPPPLCVRRDSRDPFAFAYDLHTRPSLVLFFFFPFELCFATQSSPFHFLVQFTRANYNCCCWNLSFVRIWYTYVPTYIHWHMRFQFKLKLKNTSLRCNLIIYEILESMEKSIKNKARFIKCEILTFSIIFFFVLQSKPNKPIKLKSLVHLYSFMKK